MAELTDTNGLRTFVYVTLCDHERLEVGQFRMTEQVLRIGTDGWGVIFRLTGPRQVLASAIWVWHRKRLMFYGSSGRRFLQSDVTLPPDNMQTSDFTNSFQPNTSFDSSS
ncbi:MAG: hypothetical protein O2931_11950 [Planctomycetota bacterium]|nr:hypothetical protein [Planctomycetota bacterium]MDA1179500.1 hypothetical protein [Planctomycetota bacterium]